MLSINDLISLLPFSVLSFFSITVMMVVAFYRNHLLTLLLTLTGLLLAFISTLVINPYASGMVTALFNIDRYALFYIGLICLAGFVVALLSYEYFERQEENKEEFYLLLLLAVLGSSVLAASVHFASFFLGLEILSVSLYVLIAYLRNRKFAIEAAVKYLILAAVSSAFLLFGMALVYAELGGLGFARLADGFSSSPGNLLVICGLAMIIMGAGFKLSAVPFHMWAPDVFEGASAPVAAFVATVSKGAVFALLLRCFSWIGKYPDSSIFAIFSSIAIASMFIGNLGALGQKNIKRLLAYSSVAHTGYILVAFLAGGSLSAEAVTYYLAVYFATTLGAFGVIIVLSGKDCEADDIDDFRGLAWRRPGLTLAFTVMLLSLAGIPITAGFIGKFYIIAAGVGSDLRLLLGSLIINTVIGLYYYVRIIRVMFTRTSDEEIPVTPSRLPITGSIVTAGLAILVVWLGVYPSPLMELIQKSVEGVIK